MSRESDERRPALPPAASTWRPSPVQRARAIARARSEGRSIEAIARSTGLSEKQVRRYAMLGGLPEPVLALVEAERLPMAHVCVLSNARLGDPLDWIRRCVQNHWSERELRREIRNACGSPPAGRRRTYLRREHNAIRVYAFRISRSAPKGERERVIRLLRDAIEFLGT